MVLPPALRAASASGCTACRTSVLRLFIYSGTHRTSVSSPHLRSLSSPLSAPAFARHTRHTRLYSTRQPPSSNNDIEDRETKRTEGDTDVETATQITEATAGTETNQEVAAEQADVNEQISEEEEPWYLQEEPPRHPTLVPDPQPLPDIPKSTHPILKPLVKYVFEDLGLDDLNLMDLRTLDPPPALGPSLIMLFGTARSDRHLYVAAGDLKSWLRKHGINAHADGLLGRNELKIKIRRRERKAKLLGTSATALGSDDGISAGWICVNLGTLGSPVQDETLVESDDGRFAGFGARQTGVTTIVIQIMTESKRQELDLETLWSRILARKGTARLVEDDLEYAEDSPHPNEVSIFTEGGSPKVLASPSQRRFLSTSSRCLSPSNQVTNPPNRNSPASHVDTPIDPVTYINANVAQVEHLPPNPFAPASQLDTSLDPVTQINAQVAQLEKLQAHFANFSYPEACDALAASEKGRLPAFLRKWNDALRFLPPEQSWRFRLWLSVTGRKLGLPTFTLSALRDLVQEMELTGIICHRDHYLELLRAVYLQSAETQTPLDEQSDLARVILNVMFERGEAIVTTDVIVSLIDSLARSDSQGSQQLALQAVLEKFLLQVDLPYMGEAAILRLLDAYATQDNWDRWWDVWRMPPRYQQPRSRLLYVHLWRTMAASNHQRRCREAIRQCFQEMINEDPPVRPVEEVKEALEACIRVADPDAEKIAKRLRVVDIATEQISLYEFVHLFRQLNPYWGTDRRF